MCGVRVRVTTSTGAVVEGEIFTYDSNTNTVVLGASVAAVCPRCLA